MNLKSTTGGNQARLSTKSTTGAISMNVSRTGGSMMLAQSTQSAGFSGLVQRASMSLGAKYGGLTSSISNFSSKMVGGSSKRTNTMVMSAKTQHQFKIESPQHRSSVAMKATSLDDVKVEGVASEPQEGWADMLFYSKKYDNLENLPHYNGNAFKVELMKNAKVLSTPGRGILASDESNGTCGKRFEDIGLENTEENRRKYREMLFSTPGLQEYISGAIMFDETARQSTAEGKRFTELQTENGILPGIKLDVGVALIEGTDDETYTQGLDGLGPRCAEYYAMGCRFAKWRAVVKINDNCPSELAITETAHSLARYAQICQHNGLVPIVEPEVLSDGTHDIKKCAEVSERVYNAVMNELITQGVLLEGMLLKPNMVLEGAQCPDGPATPEEVAYYTVRTLNRTITPAVPGITFLSGGQSSERAAANLSAINNMKEIKHPWTLSFSFGRALQKETLQAWEGKDENIGAAHEKFTGVCKAMSLAGLGKFEGGLSQDSSYVANYKY